MSLHSAVLRRIMPLMLLLIALPAVGSGGPGSQGPRFLGVGLDEFTIPPNLSGGVYVTTGVQDFGLGAGQFPPTSASSLVPTPAPNFMLHDLKCHPESSNNLLAHCKAHVQLLKGTGRVCQVDDPKNNLVKLIAIRAKWDTASQTLDFNSPNSVVFACEDPRPGKKDPTDTIGVIGKCVGARFFKNTSMVPSLLACMRAMRADYCGNGLSFTEMGTPIGIYDLGADGTGGACGVAGCFEASWSQGGADCISHRRYEHLIRVATMALVSKYALEYLPSVRAAANEANKFSKAAEYVVPLANLKATVPGSTPPPAPPVNLGTDQLSYCADQYPPLSQCLAQYTDFYYDDKHKIPGAGAWNPVDAVTAQYVCKAGAIRRSSLAFTRTSVRWLVPPGAAEVLPCCDTLTCP